MNLHDLEAHADIVFLTEIGALIHDLGKMSKFFIDKHTPGGKDLYKDYHHGDILEYDSGIKTGYLPNDPELKNKALQLKDLLEKAKIDYNNEKSSLYKFMKEHHHKDPITTDSFVKLLIASESFDSKEDRSDATDSQLGPKTYFSNAFGYEEEMSLFSKDDFEKERKKIYALLINLLDRFNVEKIKNERKFFLEHLKNSFSKTLGMTARAANDVSLWEHSYMSASIMRTLVCESISKKFPIVENKNQIESEKPFRILSIGWDFFEFTSQSHKIPDIVGRKETLDEIKQKIKYCIEIKYLLGNCIYEDEYGLHFLIPASLDSKDRIEKNIYELFNDELKGIVTPYVCLSRKGAFLSDLLPDVTKEIKKNRATDFKPKWMEKWEGDSQEEKLVCNVCGKGMCNSDEEEICDICKTLREKGRKKESTQTVFIDELAWNGKDYENVAMLVLNFDLDNWLNGKYVKSLFMREAVEEAPLTEKGNKISKVIMPVVGPHISRQEILSSEDIRKIEEGIKQTFDKCTVLGDKHFIASQIINKISGIPANEIDSKLNQILDSILCNYSFLEIKSDYKQKNPSPSRLMRVWNNTKEYFEKIEGIICENSYNVKRPILDVRDLKDKTLDKRAYEMKITSDAEEIDAEGFFDNNELNIVLPHATGFIERSKNMKIEITDKEWQLDKKIYQCEYCATKYLKAYRCISLSPNMALFLVSAPKTPEILEKIKEEYMKVFGKVYGKLPLHIDIIYFKRKTPFYTILDSVKRFLGYAKDEHITEELDARIRSDLEINDFVKLETDIGKIEIPKSLGNGETDYYHPYLMVENGEESIKSENYEEKHALTLKENDTIKICPSFFDFIFLDSNIRRFDIRLQNGKRPHSLFERGPRPYYVENLDEFYEIWNTSEQRCDNTQLNNFESLLVSKIKEWELKNLEDLCDKEFKELLKASMENILGISRGSPDFEIIFQSVISGVFFDVKELNHTILKRTLGGRENE